MNNNDILKSLRYLLKITDPKIVEIIKLTTHKIMITSEEITSMMKNEDVDGYQLCSDEVLSAFLDGVIILKRGCDDSRPALPLEIPLTNNIVLKKMKVAYKLKDEDIIEILKSSTFFLSKSEVSALLRRADHPNYRPCGDQVLRYFLKGLAQRTA